MYRGEIRTEKRFSFSVPRVLNNFHLLFADKKATVHGVRQELWYKIRLGTIASLQDDKRFPSNPDVVNILQNFDAPYNFHSRYGQRLTAYLQVIILPYVDKMLGVKWYSPCKTLL